VSDGSHRVGWGAFVPLLLLILALLSQVVFQRIQLRNESESLNAQRVQQKQPLEEAQKLRAQLESLAGATATLAEQGNQNAVRLRDFLQQQGITIRPPAPASGEPVESPASSP
jgi:hypothetical protein